MTKFEFRKSISIQLITLLSNHYIFNVTPSENLLFFLGHLPTTMEEKGNALHFLLSGDGPIERSQNLTQMVEADLERYFIDLPEVKSAPVSLYNDFIILCMLGTKLPRLYSYFKHVTALQGEDFPF